MKAFKILLFILFLFFFSCKTDEDQEITDPAKAILGKWELVAIGEIPYQPTGYVEYLPDSIMRWYDYQSRKQTTLAGKYWIKQDIQENQDVPENPVRAFNLLFYQDIDYPDRPLHLATYFSVIFENGKMSVNALDVIAFAPIPTYIYQRKK
jgi:hypothetical protein